MAEKPGKLDKTAAVDALLGDPFADDAAAAASAAGELPQIIAAGPEATNADPTQYIPLAKLLQFENVREIDRNMEELVQSMRVQGLLNPITVRPSREEEGFFDILAGHRRSLGAETLGWDRIAALVRDVDDIGAVEIGLTENIEREDMTDDEIGRQFRRLLDMSDGKLNQAALAARFGKDPSYVSGVLKLASAPQEIQNLVAQGDFTLAHYQAIQRLPLNKQLSLARKAVKGQIGVRKFREWIASEILEAEPQILDTYEVRPFALLATQMATPHYKPFDEADLWRYALYAAMKSFNNVRWLHTRVSAQVGPYNHIWSYASKRSAEDAKADLLELAREYVTVPVGQFALEAGLLHHLARYAERPGEGSFDIPEDAIAQQQALEETSRARRTVDEADAEDAEDDEGALEPMIGDEDV